MLVFLLLCAFLQTLWGKPLPPPLGPSFEVATNATGAAACECPAVPDDGSQQVRSVYDIVQSCLFTIFACVWSSIHPNINGPQDCWWTRTKRKVITTLCAVVAPELVLLWALKQRFAAKEIADQYNKEFKTLRDAETSILRSWKQLFRPLRKSTTRRGGKQPWTITHGFFIQMGGFILYEDQYPKEVLTYKRLAKLIQEEVIDAPIVTDRDLQDKSKGDTISKGIVVLQTTWFVLQCIVRATQHLPLSELEVLTLAFAVMNVGIYAAWWGKPQGVDMAICLLSKQVETGADNIHSAPASSHQADDQHSDDNQPLMEPDENTHEKPGWLQRKLQKDRGNYSFPVFLVRLPFRIFFWMLRPFTKVFVSSELQKQPRIQMFYSAYESPDLSGPPQRIAFVIGIIFGAIHLFGWALDFPLPRDRILWQFSAVVLTVAPFVFLITDALYAQDMDNIAPWSFALFLALVPLYIVARLMVIVIAFKAILHPPRLVLLDISWTRYIPHF